MTRLVWACAQYLILAGLLLIGYGLPSVGV